MIIGVVASIVAYVAIAYKNKRGWDDALDVWGVHGVGGYAGVLLLGIFASKLLNSGGANGLLAGNPIFFFKEFVAVSSASLYAFVFTCVSLWVINEITPVRVPHEIEADELDKCERG